MKLQRSEIFQPPNLPLIVWIVATLLTHILHYGQLNFAANLISFGAIFTWAWLEIFQGTNNFRRVLGAVIMIIVILNRL